jgi:hypothetical protein
MKKLIREVDAVQHIVQITTVDERWYIKKKSKSKSESFVPSVTWICSFYPKGTAFYKWLANHGWDESEALKNEAGDKGSKVHYAIESLIAGDEVKMDQKFINPSTEQPEELGLQEYECLMSFAKWFDDVKPEILLNEQTGFKDDHFAGTIDLICKIKNKKGIDELWIVDFKTGQYIWPSAELQLSAYKNLPVKGVDLSKARLAILQVGYKRNKNGYKFTEVEDKFDLFRSTYAIWQNETKGQAPFQKDYPDSLVINVKKSKVKETK